MSEGQPRIGVFVCHCGSNIGGWLDVPAVSEYAATLPHVVHAENNLYTCAEDGLQAIRTADAIDRGMVPRKPRNAPCEGCFLADVCTVSGPKKLGDFFR